MPASTVKDCKLTSAEEFSKDLRGNSELRTWELTEWKFPWWAKQGDVSTATLNGEKPELGVEAAKPCGIVGGGLLSNIASSLSGVVGTVWVAISHLSVSGPQVDNLDSWLATKTDEGTGLSGAVATLGDLDDAGVWTDCTLNTQVLPPDEETSAVLDWTRANTGWICCMFNTTGKVCWGWILAIFAVPADEVVVFAQIGRYFVLLLLLVLSSGKIRLLWAEKFLTERLRW